MEEIGVVDSHPVFYDKETDTVHCKDQTVPANVLMRAHRGSVDRLRLTDKLLYKANGVGLYTIGCLSFSYDEAEEIYQQLINIKK